VIALTKNGILNSNVEIAGRNGWKLFNYGVTEFIDKKRRIDGSWYMPMIRQLHVILVDPQVTLLRDDVKRKVADACASIYAVHAALRLPLLKSGVAKYQDTVNGCLDKIVGSYLTLQPTLHIWSSKMLRFMDFEQTCSKATALPNATRLNYIDHGTGETRAGI